jgi:DNA-directed RNA polymerase subunit RPC12/RpoP
MSNFYIFTEGNVRGPFSTETIALMLADGRIEKQTLLCTGKGQPWIQAADVSQVMNALKALKADNSSPQPTQMLHPTVSVQAAQKSAPATTGNFANPATTIHSQKIEVVFYCPHCSQKYSGSDTWLGREINCTRCNRTFIADQSVQPQKSAPKPQAETQAQAAKPASTAPASSNNLQEYVDWENSSGELICPHCWVRFNSDQLLYIASHPALTGDTVLGSMAQKRFAPTIFNARGQALDEMAQATSDLACPRCHLKIPATVIDEKSYYFSLIITVTSG